MANGSRDIVVVGGSAGALQPLIELVRKIPAALQAAVFVVVHRSAESPFLLPDILARESGLKVRTPQDHDPIELGTLYIAPPDFHLMVKAAEVRVVRGPKENGFRPAIDPLFRTAAASYGNRVIGVLLSGILDDGTHGMKEIKRAHGTCIVQNPNEAAQYEMPQSAIERVGVDYVVLSAEIGPLIGDLVSTEIELNRSQPQSSVDVAEGVVGALRLEKLKQPPAPLTCPDCGGALWEVDDNTTLRYRCHVGHGYTADTLRSLQDAEAEQFLWSAVRIIEEQAELQRRLASRWEDKANYSLQKRFEANAKERERTADFLRSIVIQSPEVVEPTATNGSSAESVLREYDS